MTFISEDVIYEYVRYINSNSIIILIWLILFLISCHATFLQDQGYQVVIGPQPAWQNHGNSSVSAFQKRITRYLFLLLTNKRYSQINIRTRRKNEMALFLWSIVLFVLFIVLFCVSKKSKVSSEDKNKNKIKLTVAYQRKLPFEWFVRTLDYN